MVTLVVTTMASFLTPFMGSASNVALPAMGRELSMNALSLSWVATSFLLAAAMSLVPLGRIADLYGRRRIFLWGIVLYTLSSLACSLASNAAMLIFSRFMQGIGGAMIFGTATAILISVFPFTERGKVLGINVAAVYTGLSAGPLIGGLLTQHFGWRSIFLFNAVLSLIVLFFTLWKLRDEWAEARGERFDLTGTIIYSLSLFLLMIGFSRLPSTVAFLFIVIGIAGVAAFIKWEIRTPSPLLDVSLFLQNRAFTFSNLAALIHYSATYAVSFLMSLYLQFIKDFSPQVAGGILLAQPVIQAVFSPLIGRLSDRIEPRFLASLGMALTVCGLCLLIFIDARSSLACILAGLSLLGLGFAFFSSPNVNAIMSSVDRKFLSLASGALATMRILGQMFSMGIALLIFALIIGKVQITPLYYPLLLQSMKMAFSILSILCFLGIFASLARGRMRNNGA
ncbi:multidrug resistance protein B [Syntrophus aciditrophicus SB]|uniref:Multidrug resistance protein B n=2 Tax=Syntrophus TaxID=43773 RepID=Q2LY52_SYNAS|nr:multidrug resistance protein B [Syntrophus aciditrophicus SB]OPY17981.1 MAG: Multidrug resistance protein stp [Syntrophus sp. PtaB.Bin075]